MFLSSLHLVLTECMGVTIKNVREGSKMNAQHCKMEIGGIEPPTYRMRSGRSTPELNPRRFSSIKISDIVYIKSLNYVWLSLTSMSRNVAKLDQYLEENQ